MCTGWSVPTLASPVATRSPRFSATRGPMEEGQGANVRAGPDGLGGGLLGGAWRGGAADELRPGRAQARRAT